MATTGSFTTTSNQGRSLTFSWTLKSQDIAGNSSTISWTLKGSGSASGYVKAGNFKVTIDGSVVYSSSTRIELRQDTTVASGNFTLVHNSEGAKSFTAYAEASIYYVAVNCSGSGTFALPDIARASTPTLSGSAFNVGDTITIYTNRASKNFLHTAYFKYGSNTYTIGQNIADSIAFNTNVIKSLIYANMPNSKSLSCSIQLDTYNGSTKLGSKSANITANAYKVEPTIGSISYLDTNSTSLAITGDSSKIIRNISTVQVNLSNINAKESATLSSASITINGVQKSAIITNNSAVCNFGTVDSSTDIQIIAKLTDSRGFTTQANKTIAMLDYNAPTGQIHAQRKSNFYSDTDLHVKAFFSSLGGKNQISISYQVKSEEQEAFSDAVSIDNNTTTTITLDNALEWAIRVKISDLLKSTTYNLSVPVGTPIIFYDRIKRSMGLNCFPGATRSLESEGLAIDDKIYIGSQVLYTDYIASAAGTTNLLGSYNYNLIDGLFSGMEIPENYERGYKLTAMISTQNNNFGYVAINNINSAQVNTWSGATMYKISTSKIFKESDITLEQTFNYTKLGTNLKAVNTGDYQARFYNITIHGYLVKKRSQTAISTSDMDDTSPVKAE